MNVNRNNKNIQNKSKKQITDDENEMKEGIELPSEGEEIESNYEILSSQEKIPVKYEKNLKHRHTNSGASYNLPMNPSKNINTDQLRQKITEQAQRLTQLETYKNLCETRIKQFAPNHPIPISEVDLKTSPSVYLSNTNFNELKAKDAEINQLRKKIESLEKENVSNSTINNRKNKSGTGTMKPIYLENFPNTIDNVSSEKIKEFYSKLRKYAKDLFEEKEVILETLRSETINNEEQRNYIEILRQTIESSILKNGLTPFILSIKSNHPEFYNQETPNIDVLVDLSQIKGESDKYRKELIMAQVLISELKQEVDFLKKTNEDMILKREKIKESLESGLKELDEAKLQVNILEQEKNHLNENYDEEKLFNQKLKKEIQDILNLNQNLEQELTDQARKNSDLQNQLQNQNLLNNKMNELKLSFDQLYLNYEKTMKEKTNLEIDCNKLNEELKVKKLELENLKLTLKEKEDRFDLEKKSLYNENEKLRESNKNGEKQNNELFSLNKDKEREIKKLEERFLSTQNSLSNNKKILSDYEIKNENLEKRLQDQNYLISQLKESLEETTSDKEKFYRDLSELRNQFENLNRENSKLQKQIEVKERDKKKLEEDFETLYKNNNQLEEEFIVTKNNLENTIKENFYWKEKYDKDITTKIGEINTLNKETTNIKRILDETSSHKFRLENEVDTKEKLITSLKEQIRNHVMEIKTIQANCEEFKRKIEKFNSELEKEVKSNYELNTYSNQISIKLEEASRSLQLISVEKEKIDGLRKKLSEEVNSLRRADKENHLKIHSLNSTLNEIKTVSQSSDLILRNLIEKFKTIIKNSESPPNINSNTDNNTNQNINLNRHIFTKNFVFNLREDNERNINSVTDIIRNNEDWLRILFNEIEIWHEEIKSSTKKLDDIVMKNKILEENIHRVELLKEEISVNEKKLQISVKDLNEEKKKYQQENENLQKINSKLTNDNKSLSLENKDIKDQNLTLTDELNQTNRINEELLQEKNEKHNKLSNANFQIDALEERIVIVVKEKRYLESLLVQVAKSHPSPDMSRIVNEIMNLNDSLSQLERDKLKILDSISQLNETSQIGKTDSNSNKNQILANSIKREKENLKILSAEYEKKILQKKEQIRNLENEMRSVELSEKQVQDIVYDYEFKLKLLQKELKETSEELRRIKNRNLIRFDENVNILENSSNALLNQSSSQKFGRENISMTKNLLNGSNHKSIDFSNHDKVKHGDNNIDSELNLDFQPSKDVERPDRVERLGFKSSKERERQLNSYTYKQEVSKLNNNLIISNRRLENRQSTNQNNRSYYNSNKNNLNEENF